MLKWHKIQEKKEKKSVTVWQNLLDVTVTYFWETAKIKMKKNQILAKFGVFIEYILTFRTMNIFHQKCKSSV